MINQTFTFGYLLPDFADFSKEFFIVMVKTYFKILCIQVIAGFLHLHETLQKNLFAHHQLQKALLAFP